MGTSSLLIKAIQLLPNSKIPLASRSATPEKVCNVLDLQAEILQDSKKTFGIILDKVQLGSEIHNIICLDIDLYATKMSNQLPPPLQTIVSSTWAQKTPSGGLHAFFLASPSQCIELQKLAAKTAQMLFSEDSPKVISQAIADTNVHTIVDPFAVCFADNTDQGKAKDWHIQVEVKVARSGHPPYVVLAPSSGKSKLTDQIAKYETINSPQNLSKITDSFIDYLKEAQEKFIKTQNERFTSSTNTLKYDDVNVDAIYNRSKESDNIENILRMLGTAISINSPETCVEALLSCGISVMHYRDLWWSICASAKNGLVECNIPTKTAVNIIAKFCTMIPTGALKPLPPSEHHAQIEVERHFFKGNTNHPTPKTLGTLFQYAEVLCDPDYFRNMKEGKVSLHEEHKDALSIKATKTILESAHSATAEMLLPPIGKQDPTLKDDTIKRETTRKNQLTDVLISKMKEGTVGHTLYKFILSNSREDNVDKNAALEFALTMCAVFLQQYNTCAPQHSFKNAEIYDKKTNKAKKSTFIPDSVFARYLILINPSGTNKNVFKKATVKFERFLNERKISTQYSNLTCRNSMLQLTQLRESSVHNIIKREYDNNKTRKQPLSELVKECTKILMNTAAPLKNKMLVQDELVGSANGAMIFADDSKISSIHEKNMGAIWKELYDDQEIDEHQTLEVVKGSRGVCVSAACLSAFSVEHYGKMDKSTGKSNRPVFITFENEETFFVDSQSDDGAAETQLAEGLGIRLSESVHSAVDTTDQFLNDALFAKIKKLHAPKSLSSMETNQMDANSYTLADSWIETKEFQKLCDLSNKAIELLDRKAKIKKKKKKKVEEDPDTDEEDENEASLSTQIKVTCKEISDELCAWNPSKTNLGFMIHFNKEEVHNNFEKYADLLRRMEPYQGAENQKRMELQGNYFAQRFVQNASRAAGIFSYCFTDKSGTEDCISLDTMETFFELYKCHVKIFYHKSAANTVAYNSKTDENVASLADQCFNTILKFDAQIHTGTHKVEITTSTIIGMPTVRSIHRALPNRNKLKVNQVKIALLTLVETERISMYTSDGRLVKASDLEGLSNVASILRDARFTTVKN